MDLKTLSGKDFENLNFDEQFLIMINDMKTMRPFCTLTKSRKECAELFANLSTDKYTVYSVNILTNYKDYDVLMKQLKKENKPDDLHYGVKDINPEDLIKGGDDNVTL